MASPASSWTALRSVLRFRPIELDPVARRLRRAANVEDLRRVARRRLPRGVFDYVDGAAEDERTLVANSRAFARIGFTPRVLRDVSSIEIDTTLLGRSLTMPLVLAPTGFTRIVHSQGELAVARSAARAGVPYALSTLATRSIEEVASVSSGRRWFQVYVWRDRGLVAELLDRASAGGYEAIVITVDAPVLGRRERDVRRGFTLPPRLGPGTVVDGLLHPGWTWDFVWSDPITFANVAGKGVGDGSDPVSLSEYIDSQFDPELSWDDLDWFRRRWKGPIVLKGIQSVEDAEMAVRHGVDAIALSNHGGRQLDGAPDALSLVAPVADVVAGRAEIICDGGVRRGSDVAKALAFGAQAVMVGRPYLYALAAGGEQGVDHVLAFFADGLRRTMALLGCRTVGELDRGHLRGV